MGLVSALFWSYVQHVHQDSVELTDFWRSLHTRTFNQGILPYICPDLNSEKLINRVLFTACVLLSDPSKLGADRFTSSPRTARHIRLGDTTLLLRENSGKTSASLHQLVWSSYNTTLDLTTTAASCSAWFGCDAHLWKMTVARKRRFKGKYIYMKTNLSEKTLKNLAQSKPHFSRHDAELILRYKPGTK